MLKYIRLIHQKKSEGSEEERISVVVTLLCVKSCKNTYLVSVILTLYLI